MAYVPKTPPEFDTLTQFKAWVEEELRSLAIELNRTRILELEQSYREPAKLRDGMIIFADGTSFDPGAGAGTYERRGGAWVKL